MANITVRNIPEDVFAKIKRLATLERRSINNEILIVLESALASEGKNIHKPDRETISKDLQLRIWEDLSGKWEDSRTTEEIKGDILENRTLGRNINL